MKTRGVAAALVFLLLSPALAVAQIQVAASTAELESLARAVGGSHATVGRPANPSDASSLRAARVVVRVGLGYDAWLDPLLERSGNPAIQRDAKGYVDASREAAVIGLGAQANPRYWLDPVNARSITGSILHALVAADPANAKDYTANRDAFVAELEKRMHEWNRALPRPSNLIAQGEAWEYFARRFRLKLSGVIEPRPGVAPTAQRLQELGAIRKVTAILREPDEPPQHADALAAKTGAPVVIVASRIGAVPGARDYFSLIDHDVKALAAQSRKEKKKP